MLRYQGLADHVDRAYLDEEDSLFFSTEIYKKYNLEDNFTYDTQKYMPYEIDINEEVPIIR